MNGWPLISFTILLELACGSAIASTLVDWMTRRTDLVPMRQLGISIFPLALVALLASLFHLGRPFASWRALTNMGSSPLSLEVFFCALFVLSALVYSYLWWADRSSGRPAAGIATCILGAAAVISSATVYLIPAQPAWNSGWVPCSLLGTVLLFGGTFPWWFADYGGGPLRKMFLVAGLAGGLILLASIVWMLGRLMQSPSDEFVAAGLRDGLHLMTAQYGVWLGLQVALAGVLPIVTALRVWHSAEPHEFGMLARRLVFLGVFLGVTIGRALMFALESIQNRTLPT